MTRIARIFTDTIKLCQFVRIRVIREIRVLSHLSSSVNHGFLCYL